MDDPFADLIPAQNVQAQAPAQQQVQQQVAQDDPFADLIPASNNVPQGTSNASPSVDENDGWHLNNIGRHLLAQAGSAIQNTFRNVDLPKIDEVDKRIPQIPGRNANLYKDFGIQKGFADTLGQGTMEFLPYMAGGGGAVKAVSEIPAAARFFSKFAADNPMTAKIAGAAGKNIIANDAMALNQGDPNSTGSDLLYGTATGLAAPVLGYGLGAANRAMAEKVAQSAIPGLTSRATNYMRNLLDPNDYAAQLYNRFSSMFNKNRQAWADVNKTASNIDQRLTKTNAVSQAPKTSSLLDESGNPIQMPQPDRMVSNVDFNASPYHSYINDFTNKVNALEPAQRAPYQQALSLAEQARELAPQSLSGTVSARQNINQNLKEFLNQQGSNTANNAMNAQSKQFLTGLKNTLQKNISQSNVGNVGEEAMQDFTDKWAAANKAHQDLQEFYRSPQPGTGIVKPVKQTREAYQAAQQGQQLDPAIIGKYMPRPNQSGTQGLEQLSKLYDSKEQAQAAAKAYINRRPLSNGVSTLDVTNEYAKLSPAQRDWIYGDSKEGQLLKAANNARQSFGKEPGRSLLTAGTHHLLGYGLPGMAGYLASAYAGGNWRDDLLSGIATSAGVHGLGKLVGKLPLGIVNPIINYGESAPVNPGRYMNIALQGGRYGGNQQ